MSVIVHLVTLTDWFQKFGNDNFPWNYTIIVHFNHYWSDESMMKISQLISYIVLSKYRIKMKNALMTHSKLLINVCVTENKHIPL